MVGYYSSAPDVYEGDFSEQRCHWCSACIETAVLY